MSGCKAQGLRWLHPFAVAGPALAIVFACAIPSARAQAEQAQWTTAQICSEIARLSTVHDLPRATFTRLIWTESRFDVKALSPVGAQGIAQFMPATAAERGLDDPFDPAQALPASAALLAELRDEFGNFGLAAMAYNAGPSRISRWLARRSNLPFETQDYVAAITGQRADAFRKPTARVLDFSLEKGKSFTTACRRLPIRKTRATAVVAGGAPFMPWGVQVAGNFSRTRAMNSWTRLRTKLHLAIGNTTPRLYRQRTPRGLKSKWAVRLGARTRKEAGEMCAKIKRVGGSCVVRRNR